MRVLFISLFVFLIDQGTKLFIKGFSIPFLNIKHAGISYGQKNPIISNFFNITFIENPGIAFGINFGEKFKLLISIFTILTSIGLLWYLYINKKRSFGVRLSLALIIGGAFGNLADRIFYGLFYGYAPLFYGRVVDFLEIKMFNIFILNHVVGNYIFNIADVAVTAGVILLLFSFYKERKKVVEPQNTLESALVENKE